jgi:hypothetical protein
MPEPLKMKAAEARLAFPTRNDWDAYFRDAKHMNEMKAGKFLHLVIFILAHSKIGL